VRRRELMTGIGSAAVAWPRFVHAQDRPKPYQIGVLETVAPALNRANLDALHAGMRERGYTEGRDYVLHYRTADGQNDRFAALATELLKAGVDLILTRGTPAALAAKAATSTVPIVMAAIGEPLAVVSSLARPGGNITGLTSLSRELAAKRLSILKECVPSLRRPGALLNLSNPTLRIDWIEINRTAGQLGMEAVLFDIRTPQDITAAFDALVRERVDSLVVSIDSLTQTNAIKIVQGVKDATLPATFPSREFASFGGLMSFSVNYSELYKRSATYIDRIIRGAQPADLPVEQPVRFELILNLKTASNLGLTIPPLVLARADEVIE
jgi:putative tryptophan/tyrosine transport system substrate-binding protein